MKKIMSKFLKTINEKGIIHIQSTRNNTILTLTDLQGNTKFWSSAGNLGFKNSRKSTSYAAQAVAETVAAKALNLGFNSIIVKMKGLGYGKLSAIRALSKSKLSIEKIIELTSIAHNGCRPPKKRRV
jgi:small subunit ribosomal protein S11